MKARLAALVLVALVLAGCGGKSRPSDEPVVVQSILPEEVRSGETQAVQEPAKRALGHLGGVVVDEAIRPIEGATVRIPGMDLVDTTDRDGSFGFVDLGEGPYFVTVEHPQYYGAETTMEVREGDVARAKFVLTAIPPQEPYHVTQEFRGFSPVTDPALLLVLGFCTCDFDLWIEMPGLSAVVLEATMPAGMVPGGDAFEYQVREPDTCCDTLAAGEGVNPLRAELRGLNLTDGHYRLQVYPLTAVPEANKSFDVYVTTFYHGLPPPGWSFVAGNP